MRTFDTRTGRPSTPPVRTPHGRFELSGRVDVAMARRIGIGSILLIALLAFELFNFDTTRFALTSLLGSVSFLGVSWAGILALAFGSIDFAGLFHLFTVEAEESTFDTSHLLAAWLLAASMNAVMTWWAVSLTLLDSASGNEIMSRETLLRFVPIFVAILVWLTRILFISAFSVAGRTLFVTDHPIRSADRLPSSPFDPVAPTAVRLRPLVRPIDNPLSDETDFPLTSDRTNRPSLHR